MPDKPDQLTPPAPQEIAFSAGELTVRDGEGRVLFHSPVKGLVLTYHQEKKETPWLTDGVAPDYEGRR